MADLHVLNILMNNNASHFVVAKTLKIRIFASDIVRLRKDLAFDGPTYSASEFVVLISEPLLDETISYHKEWKLDNTANLFSDRSFYSILELNVNLWILEIHATNNAV